MSSRRCARSAPRGARSCARSCSKGSSSACSRRCSGSLLGLGIAKGMSALFAAMGVDLPECGTVLAAAHGDRQPAHGHARDARGQHRPGAARDPRPADLGGPRGLGGHDAAPARPRAARGCWSPASSLALIAARACSAAWLIALRSSSACSTLFVGIAMLAPRLVKPLAALVGSGARLGGCGRLARENAVRNPGPHGLHGRGADDRPRAGHRRRHARRRPARLDRGRGQEAGQRRLRRHGQGRRRLVPGRVRPGRRRAPAQDRLERPLGHREGRRRRVASRGIDATTIDHFSTSSGQRARSRGSTTAARSSATASPSSTT